MNILEQKCNINFAAVIYKHDCIAIDYALIYLYFRLLAYERNFNFGVETNDTADFHMTLPNQAIYKDINTSMSLPSITIANINSWLSENGKTLTAANPPSLYTSSFLRVLRSVKHNNLIFIKGQCSAEMKKHISYWIDISIDAEVAIIEGQCDCAAGMGPKANCKHICVVLYALYDLTCRGQLQLQTTCTQELQTFHKAKPFLASPLKANIILPKKATVNNNTNAPLNFDPRSTKYQNAPGYTSFVRNMVLNYCYQSSNGESSMPFVQMYNPANPYALESDHQYMSKTCTDKLLDDLHVTAITPEIVTDIERNTHGQADNKYWLENRCLRLHSSNFGKICKATDRMDKNEFARRLTTCNDLRSVPAIIYGKENESTAIEKYKEVSGKNVSRCGTFVSCLLPYLAASPDGLVNDNLLIEVKCPFSARNQLITNTSVPYLYKEVDENSNTCLKLDSNHDYYYQVQGQLFASNRSMCDFVVYTQKDIYVSRIVRDQIFIDKMIEKLTLFFNDYFKPALKHALFYHNYYAFKF